MVLPGMCPEMTVDEIIIMKYFFHFHIDYGKGEERENVI